MLEEFEWYLYSDTEDSVLTIYTEPLKPSKKSRASKPNNKEAKIPTRKEEKTNKTSKIVKNAKDNKTEEEFINENGYSCVHSGCSVKCFSMNTFIKHITKLHLIPCVWKGCSFKGKCSCELQKHIENHWNKFKEADQQEAATGKTLKIETALESSIKHKKDNKAKPDHTSVRPLSDSIILKASTTVKTENIVQDKPKLVKPSNPEPKIISKPPPVAAKSATRPSEYSKLPKKMQIENDSTESRTDSDSKENLPRKRGVTAKKTVVPPGKKLKRFTACGESPYIESPIIKNEINLDSEDEQDQSIFIKNIMEKKKNAQKWNPSDAFARALESQRL